MRSAARVVVFFFQAEDGIRDLTVTGVQTCALPISGPSGINPGFPGLSRYQGWVTHVLLTRSPLSPGPKAWFSLDLHVLSAPPAFVLSQDQTLREEWIAGSKAGEPFTSSLLACSRAIRCSRNCAGRRGIDNCPNRGWSRSRHSKNVRC